MRGFGPADGSALGGRLRIEIRTVNHRYYNPQFKLPFELAGMEGSLRDRLRQLLDRGHVAVTARWLEPPPGEGTVMVDLARARRLVAALRELKRKLKLKGEPDLTFVARQPDVLTIRAHGERGVMWEEVGVSACGRSPGKGSVVEDKTCEWNHKDAAVGAEIETKNEIRVKIREPQQPWKYWLPSPSPHMTTGYNSLLEQ